MGLPTSIRSSVMDPLLNFKYIVSWGVTGGDLKQVAGVSKIGPLARSTEVAEYREGAAPMHTRKIPGQTKYDDINLERGIILDIEFEQWANKIWFYENSNALGQNVSLADFRKTLKIEMCNQAGQVMFVYYIFNSWPTKYQAVPELNAQDGATVALETLTLANEGWARDTTFSPAAYPSYAEPAEPLGGAPPS